MCYTICHFKNFERYNIHHPTSFYGWHHHFYRKPNQCRGCSAPLIKLIYPRKVCQQQTEVATAIGNAAASYNVFLYWRLFCFSNPQNCNQSGACDDRYVVQQAQSLYRRPAVAVETTCNVDSYALRTVRFTSVIFSIVQQFCWLDTISIFRKKCHSTMPKGKRPKRCENTASWFALRQFETSCMLVVSLSSTAAEA